MYLKPILGACAALLFVASCATAPDPTAPNASMTPNASGPAPREWIDPDTGHRVVRLSDEDGTQSLYFHQNAYTPEGDLVIVNGPRGIMAINLATREGRLVVPNANAAFVGRRSRTVFFMHPVDPAAAAGAGGTIVMAADIDSGATREIGGIARGSVVSINADETLLLGSFAERDFQLQTGARDPRFEAQYEGELRPDGTPYTFAEAKERRMDVRLESRIPMEMFVMNVSNGRTRTVYRATDWLNHLQFSPTDSDLIMFCHEGPWHKVDRIWTIRTDGSQRTLIHRRTMNMEIAGHEFFSPDGRSIYYDLQTPRGEVFWLASYDLATGARTWRNVQRNEWSVHFYMSRDGSMILGDGGDSEMVAHAPDGKWLYLFRSQPIPDVADIHAPGADTLIRPATLESERLVNMRNHDYRLEPNATFTPDGRWLIFRSNMHGAAHVYAVEVARARPAP